MSRAMRCLVAAMGFVLLLCGGATSARADKDNQEDAPAVTEKEVPTPPSRRRSRRGRRTRAPSASPLEMSAYTDTDNVTVFTPSVNASIENVTQGASIRGHYLVDVVSAASADIVSTASGRWTEVRQAGGLEGTYKPRETGFTVAGAMSSEPDYLSLQRRRPAHAGLQREEHDAAPRVRLRPRHRRLPLHAVLGLLAHRPVIDDQRRAHAGHRPLDRRLARARPQHRERRPVEAVPLHPDVLARGRDDRPERRLHRLGDAAPPPRAPRRAAPAEPRALRAHRAHRAPLRRVDPPLRGARLRRQLAHGRDEHRRPLDLRHRAALPDLAARPLPRAERGELLAAGVRLRVADELRAPRVPHGQPRARPAADRDGGRWHQGVPGESRQPEVALDRPPRATPATRPTSTTSTCPRAAASSGRSSWRGSYEPFVRPHDAHRARVPRGVRVQRPSPRRPRSRRSAPRRPGSRPARPTAPDSRA